MAHLYSATVEWSRGEARFTDNRYSRAHQWRFDGGAVVPASSSPQVVRIPLSDPSGVDPEEAFVASLSSCHMLWFLSIAAERGWTVDRYLDEAEGEMAKNERGQLVMSRVTLRPAVQFAGEPPSVAEAEAAHHEAHESCFIANSVRTNVLVEPKHGSS